VALAVEGELDWDGDAPCGVESGALGCERHRALETRRSATRRTYERRRYAARKTCENHWPLYFLELVAVLFPFSSSSGVVWVERRALQSFPVHSPPPILQLSSLPVLVSQLCPKSLRLSKVSGTRRVKRPGNEQKNWDSLRMSSSGRSTLRELSQSEEKQTLQHELPLGVYFAPLIGWAWR
jgi:hypothetical protein